MSSCRQTCKLGLQFKFKINRREYYIWDYEGFMYLGNIQRKPQIPCFKDNDTETLVLKFQFTLKLLPNYWATELEIIY